MTTTNYTPKYIPKGEECVLRAFIDRMAGWGWKPYAVNDGGERIKVATPDAALEVIDSVSEAMVLFKKGDEPKGYSVLVVVNCDPDPLCCIADYATADGFGDAADAVLAGIESAIDLCGPTGDLTL